MQLTPYHTGKKELNLFLSSSAQYNVYIAINQCFENICKSPIFNQPCQSLKVAKSFSKEDPAFFMCYKNNRYLFSV